MGCFTEPGDIEITLLTPGFNAIQRAADGRVEIWCEEWEIHYATFPSTTPGDALEEALRLFLRGRDEGEITGRERAMANVRGALGL